MASLPIASSAISFAAYDNDTGDLQLTFARGGSYTLRNVPAVEVARLISADSPGAYFNTNMKGNY